ncbi:glycosyltransferase family 2 protein [Pseudomonas oryzihabitans]|uniref:glycosyltransferase family 2 protein n=1 Tax=Pseudomonas oryzihabitans TaxID=47885 RepID=UPI00197F4DE2|nr:glycosyltransferase family 2 protein [Pseudomonas psychrotolerans]
MSVNIVITMAGRGSRFTDAGYLVPKYEILAHGKSLFDWSMLSLKNFFSPDCCVIFVCLKSNGSAEYVHKRCHSLGLKNVQVIELDSITDGQATSAYLTKDLWRADWPLLIYNIDTFVTPSSLSPDFIREGSDAWVPCFQVPGDHWSFVKLGSDQWATEFSEKRRISNFASIGLYWFARAEYFSQAYESFFSKPDSLVKGERYIAPLYQELLFQGLKISILDLPVEDVHVLGTPQELDSFLQKSPNQFEGMADL